MPRIDPLQLLSCLQVLLSRNGGIQSKEEVQRLVNLMTKFSKKLVSKCIYILILKNTETDLIGQFMADGGWNLVYVWLQDAICNNNNSLIKELLDLLLITPVDVERLKTNNIPKLVKNLTKRDDAGVQELANKLVHVWLKIVKDQTQTDASTTQSQQLQIAQPKTIVVPAATTTVVVPQTETTPTSLELENSDVQQNEENEGAINSKSFYKVSVRDGKQVISRFAQQNQEASEDGTAEEIETTAEANKEEKSEEDKKKEKSSHDKSKHRSSRSSSKSSSSSKHKDKEKSSSSSKDKKSKEKDKRDKSKDKDKHKNNGSVKSSSSSKDKDKSKKETKEKQAEKDKDTLAKVLPQTLQKLGRIPKKPATDEKSKENKEIKKDKNFSIEPRKSGEERPRTVKIFNAKMRSTGLEEEVKPPPPRSGKKPTTPSVTLPTIPQKRPSPVKDIPLVLEKKPKIDIPERPGAIKLIPPKPKPAVLQESDIFMDALTASATTKKEPKKRKRRTSVSKDSTGSPPQSPSVTTPQQHVPTPTSPTVLKNITLPNFYQDTLETTERQTENDIASPTKEDESEDAGDRTPTDTGEPPSKKRTEDTAIKVVDGTPLKGVLLHTRRPGPKKSIRWKPDNDLVEVQYFELDETERVNVTKNFMDMARMEVSSEREALQMSRKLQNEDLMDSHTAWRVPIMIDLPVPLALPGSRSLEKDIQFAREKIVLQALYFSKNMLPESPAEPDPENHQMTDPIMIPLEDPENNTEEDLRGTPWPEPKGSPPPEPTPVVPNIFPNLQQQNTLANFANVPPPGFQGVPPFAGPGNFMPPNMMPHPAGQIMNPNVPPPDMMNQMPMFRPGGQPPNHMMNENFPMQFNQMNMFPPNNFNMRGRGSFRRGGGGPWVRMNGPGPGWHNRGGGNMGPHRGGRLCKNVKNHGYCKNRNNCTFIHPN